MFEVGEPQTGAEFREAMQRLLAQGHEFLGALPAEQFHAPQGERWSPAEHVRHLRKSTSPLGRALKLPRLVLRWKFGKGPGTSRSFLALRQTYRDGLAAGGKAGRFTPSPEPAPTDPSLRRTQILAAWTGAVEELDAATGRWQESALDRYLLPHPLLGNLTVREMLMFTVFHTTHHLDSVARRAGGGA